MTITETYDFLWSPRNIDRRIRRLILLRDELQSCLLPSAIRYDGDRVQVTPEDKLAAIAAKVLDLDRQIQRLREEKADAVLAISEAVDRLGDEAEKTVLTAYYIGRVPIRDVAEMIHYSHRQTYRILQAAVRHIAELQDGTNGTEECDTMVS